MQDDRVVANRPQSSIRQPNLAALDLDARLGSRFRDVGRADRAEELALGTRLRRDDEFELFQRGSSLPRRGQVLVSSLLELSAPGLETLDVVRRGHRGLALRQQEVTAETGL